jgi:N,N'-diacetyllegionaminate synthase
MSRKPLALGGRLVGEGQPCLMVAHVGHAHEGSAERALRLIEAAFQAGADAIVFSVFRAEELVVRRHPERRELEQLELPEKDWRQVLEAARASGLALIVEAYDLASRDLALAAGADALQSHPTDADHPELLRALAASGRPLLLAAGDAGEPLLREITEAAAGTSALLLGPASAPAPIEELRLGAWTWACWMRRTAGRPSRSSSPRWQLQRVPTSSRSGCCSTVLARGATPRQR